MVDTPVTLLTTGLFISLLLLIIYIDLRQRKVLNILSLPATFLALLLGFAHGLETFILALAGAAAGFLFLYLLYWLGNRLYGAGALGFGDVKLAMLLGSIVGLQYILHTLTLGLFIGGLAALFLLRFGFASRGSKLPYGAFMATAGIIMLVWIAV